MAKRLRGTVASQTQGYPLAEKRVRKRELLAGRVIAYSPQAATTESIAKKIKLNVFKEIDQLQVFLWRDVDPVCFFGRNFEEKIGTVARFFDHKMAARNGK